MADIFKILFFQHSMTQNHEMLGFESNHITPSMVCNSESEVFVIQVTKSW